MYAYVASLLRDRSAAEDVTAQAFERAYRKRRGYRPSRGTAEAWLFGIARNAALDELRRRKRGPPWRATSRTSARPRSTTTPRPRCAARSSGPRSPASTAPTATSWP